MAERERCKGCCLMEVELGGGAGLEVGARPFFGSSFFFSSFLGSSFFFVSSFLPFSPLPLPAPAAAMQHTKEWR